MSNELVPLLQLMHTKGIGPRSIARILDQIDEDNLTLQDLVAMDAEDMAARFHLKEDQVHAIGTNQESAANVAALLEDHQIRTVLRGGPLYPTWLKSVLRDKAPPVLFVAGAVNLLEQRGVGFCGARDASEQAIRCADQVARALALKDLLVVSGHAQGVDETAHLAALRAGGRTALVLPEGILHFRPRPGLGEFMTQDAVVVVSEFPPRLPWSVANAMQRNRTICGLVRALIVIEAGTSGGTWDAGRTALELGIPLFVLEYPNPAPSGQGNHLLVRQGGLPLTCHPGNPPDISLLLKTLELPLPVGADSAPTLFDHIADEV